MGRGGRLVDGWIREGLASTVAGPEEGPPHWADSERNILSLEAGRERGGETTDRLQELT